MKERYLRMLCIDDDPGYRKVITRFFTSTGSYLVEAAENGREGLKKAAKLRPDVILLDMNMPDMNGLEVMDKLYADTVTQAIPVIIITGACLSDDVYNILKNKPNFLLFEQKPVKLNELLIKIENILGTKTMCRENCEPTMENSPEPA